MEDFDIGAAVDEIGSGMGFEPEDTGTPETVEPPAPPAGDPDPAPAPAPAPAPTAPTPTDTTAAAVPPPPTTSPVATPPRTWKPEAAAEWDKLPERVKEEVLKREDDMFRGLESYKGDATIGKAVNQVFQPFRDIARMDNLDAGQVLHEGFSMHVTLSRGTPEQKVAALNNLAAKYGVQLAPADPDSAPYVDPQVASLRAELDSVKSQLSGTARQQQEFAEQQAAATREKLMAEVETFAKDPANADFDLLSEQITALLRSKSAKDLRDAYDQAVWLHPVTRQKAIDSAAAAKAEAEKKSQAEAAAKAKAATSANVRTQAKNASGTAASGSMDDTLAEAYERINARGK